MQQRKQNWVRRWEHPALSFFSLIFAAVSAHAILWFYSSMDGVQVNGADFIQPLIKWGLAAAFTGFGYLASRGLAHRLLRGERVGVYIMICIVLELVEVTTNFMYSAVAIQHIGWLHLFSGTFLTFLTALIYLVMPIVPIVTVVLAWVDMDLQRQKEGDAAPSWANRAASPGYQAPRPATAAQHQVRPMVPPIQGRGPAAAQPATPTYGRGYTGVPRVTEMAETRKLDDARQGGFKFPFRRAGGSESGEGASVGDLLHDREKQLASIP
jgi:hypothetical protein